MQNSLPSFDLQPASRLDGIDLSEIVQISERAARLSSAGQDIVALSTGEPDLPTPDHILDAAHAAARAGQTRYTATAGTPELREAVAQHTGVEAPNVLISTGAKQVIANAMLATLNAGDEVIMPAPFWTSYADIVRLAGGVPLVVPCGMETGFKLTPDALAAAVTPRSRWLMLNSPSNPSGAVYAADEIAALARVLETHPGVMVLADEIYRELCYVPFASFTDAAPTLRDRTLIVDGVSKAYSMTGWRIGWGIGPAALISALIKVQGQVTSGACSIAQAAALAAVTGDRSLLDTRRAVFLKRRETAVSGLNAVTGLICPAPDGAFYVFPSCKDLLAYAGGPFVDDAALCAWLLDAAGVAIVPGRAFGLPGHLRLSFAYSDSDLSSALVRITDALERKTP